MLKDTRALTLATLLALAPLSGTALAQDLPLSERLPSFSGLVNEARPAVVTVMTSGRAAPLRMQGRDVPEGMEEFFRRFMPDNREFHRPAPRRDGLGSGFIIAEDGVIVTNNHVVEGAEDITVRLSDGREFAAELVGADDKVDLAVIQIQADGLPLLAWGTSDDVEVGDWTLAIGNPFGLGGTVTTGIVSARGRDIGSGPYDDYLQVDAAINRGNSGGPLLDLNGRVIGVNTMIYSPSGGSVGLGFAIPSDQAQVIVADLLDDGEVERGFIGVQIQGVNPDIAESLGLDAATGALVSDVTEGSPAAAAGIRPGDVILTFAGTEIGEVRDLTRAVAASAVGADVEVEVWRRGEALSLTIAPERMASAATAAPAQTSESALGLALRPLLPSEAAEAGVGAGLLVAEVAPDGPGAAAGLRPGDLVLSANQRPLASAAEIDAVVTAAQRLGRDAILLQIQRGDTVRFLTVDMPSS
ncbi:MAG: Do family serine endopeptidase [Pseudomonadota bacterium]